MCTPPADLKEDADEDTLMQNHKCTHECAHSCKWDFGPVFVWLRAQIKDLSENIYTSPKVTLNQLQKPDNHSKRSEAIFIFISINLPPFSTAVHLCHCNHVFLLSQAFTVQ